MSSHIMSLPYWHFAHNFRVLKHALGLDTYWQVWWVGLRLLIFPAPVAAGLQKSERGPFGCRCPNLRRTSRRAHKFGRLPQLQLGCICRRQRLAFVVPRLFRPQDAPRLRSSTGLEQVRLCYVRAKQKARGLRPRALFWWTVQDSNL